MKSFLDKLNKYKTIPICITVIMLLARIALSYIAKKKQLYLEHDYMYNIINYLILIMAVFIYFKNIIVRYTYWGVLLVLIIVNSAGIYNSIDNVQFQNRFTYGENSFIVKETKEDSKFISVYTNSHKIFIHLVDKISVKSGYKPFSNNDYEVIWINAEKALIKYGYGNNLDAKCHILNFSKINEAYSNVLASLEGKWTDKDNKENTLTFDRGQITYKSGNKIYWYSSSMADEQGNYGTVLYGANDTPALYLLKNKDNTLTFGYVELKNNKQSVYIKK